VLLARTWAARHDALGAYGRRARMVLLRRGRVAGGAAGTSSRQTGLEGGDGRVVRENQHDGEQEQSGRSGRG